MPRNVRNFWIDLAVDGKQERIETGPRSKDGGFNLVILVRENGSISDKRVYIEGRVIGDKLRIDATVENGQRDCDGRLVLETER